jgi:hypothetical protein
MAYTQANFVRDLALWSTATLLSKRRQQQMIRYAAKKGIQLAGAVAAPMARAALPALPAFPVIPGAVQTATPYAIGAGLGLGALQTQPGQDLLAAAEEHGRQSRILYERAQQEIMTTPQQLAAAFATSPVSPSQVVPRIRKRAASKFNKAVSAGMKVVKQTTTYGGKGKIKPAKKAFALVTKLASAKLKRKKAPKSGIRRKIWNAMKGLR